METSCDSHLCPECAAVDFSAYRKGEAIEVLREIGSGCKLSPKGACSLCDMMHWMLDAPPNDVERNQLCLVRGASFEAMKGEGHDYRQPDGWSQGFMKLGRPSDTVQHWGRPYHSISDAPRIATFVDPTFDGPRGKYAVYCQPGMIVSERINYAVIGALLAECRKTHKSCRPSAPPTLPIRLIDCAKAKVVEAPEKCEYTTLSYVWGVSPDKSSLSNDGSIANAPATIRDAMNLTLTLGYKYIWIDRYCIDQGSSADKLAQIRQMGSIYQASVLTIFAACGSTPEYGLPGAGARSRMPQMKRVVNGREMVGLLDHPRKLVENSTWMTRAWTYQEAMLSKRRLFFTDQQVYFECRENLVRDEIFVPREPLYRGDSGLGGRMASGSPNRAMFSDMSVEYFDSVETFDYISKYSERQLTFESDRLNALLGIFQVLAEHKFPVFHIQGIPLITSTPAPRNCWGPPKPRPIWSLTSAFMAGMTWNVQPGLRRDIDCPSWTWLSWTGSVSWGSKKSSRPWWVDAVENPQEIFKAAVWIENSDGCLQTLDEFENNGAALGYSLPRIIHVESETFDVTVTYLSSPFEGFHKVGNGTGSWSQIRSPGHSGNMATGYWACFDAKSGIKSFVALNLFSALEPEPHSVSYKVVIIVPESHSLAFHVTDGSQGKLLSKAEDAYEVCGHIYLSWQAIYFKLPQDGEVELSEVTPEMILPKMTRERLPLI